MPKEAHLELKVGFFVILAFILLTVFVFSVGDFSAFEKGQTVRVIFDFASGIKKSSPVRVAGVDAGLVQAVDLFFDHRDGKTKADVRLWLRDGTRVPSDSEVMINQLGLFGEKYVEIIPGMDENNFYKEGDVVIGTSPLIQERLTRKIGDVAVRIERGIGEIQSTLTNEENAKTLRSTLSHLNSLSVRLDDVLSSVQSGKGTVGRLFYDEGIYDDLRLLAEDLKKNPWKLLYRPEQETRKK